MFANYWAKKPMSWLRLLPRYNSSWWAKAYFNYTTVCPQSGELRTGDTKLAYGVVEYSAALSDLEKWDTLVAARFMMHPHTLLPLNECPE